MKHLTLLLLAITLAKLPGYTQSVKTTATEPSNAAVSLAGVSGPTIDIRQIQAQPVVRVAQAQPELTSFDFSWTIKTEPGSSDYYMGPYHNSGSRLNTTIMTSLLKDAVKGTVTRIYIDRVSAAGPDGVVRKYAGATYKVTP